MATYKFNFDKLTTEDFISIWQLSMVGMNNNNPMNFFAYLNILGQYCETGMPELFSEVIPFCEDARLQFQEYTENYQKDREII